jgi:hypothetical protein
MAFRHHPERIRRRARPIPLNAARKARGATWQQAADRLHCTPSQLIGLRTAKFATIMELAMRVTQALRRPAADFVYAAQW